jgi:N-acyl-phosphatidylethanolamine-hydrolysing phospholipase D
VFGKGGRSFWFAGDTGYCPVFEQIGARLGPFDLAAVPIGAYEPRWMMKPQHVNPEEAVSLQYAAVGWGFQKNSRLAGNASRTARYQIATHNILLQPPPCLYSQVRIHQDVRSRRSIGIHFGTFCLTDEAMDEPVALLSQELAKAALPPSAFLALLHGALIVTADGQDRNRPAVIPPPAPAKGGEQCEKKGGRS